MTARLPHHLAAPVLALLAPLAALLLLAACDRGDAPPETPDAVSTEAPLAPATENRATEEQMSDYLDRLVQNLDVEERFEVLTLIQRTGDPRFAIPLVDVWAFNSPEVRDAILDVLEGLTGEHPAGPPGEQFFALFEWVAANAAWPKPDGYLDWKARALRMRGGEGFDRFLRSDQPSRIRPELILWGGVDTDGIPPLEQPDFTPGRDADYLLPEEPVFGVVINGDARAYPLRILDWHEMANDVIGGLQVSLAYCTLCGAAILFATETEEHAFTFGTSGLLYESNKLMYDRQTDSLWNQLTGQPVLGPLAGSDITLERLPVVRASWAEWLAAHPDTLVLSLDTGFHRNYEPGAVYGAYFASEDVLFPIASRSRALPGKAEVYALLVDGEPAAYPLDLLIEAGVVNDRIGQTSVVLVAGRAAGVRAYERGETEFHASEGGPGATVVDDAGDAWQVTEDALVHPDGRRLERRAGHLSFWFGWFSFYPHTSLYGIDE